MTHGLGVLGVRGVAELQQSLKLIVSGEGDDLQHRAELTEDLTETHNCEQHVNTNNNSIQPDHRRELTCCRTSRVTG